MDRENIKSPEAVRAGLLASGELVVDRPQSHIHDTSPEFRDLLRETLAEVESADRPFLVYTKEFSEQIGMNHCVETGSDKEEQITYAIRRGRKGHTRFVRGKKPQPTNHMTVVLKAKEDEEQTYLLITAFVGPQAAKEPWDPLADEADREFWEKHALIWNPDLLPFVPGTVTNTRPETFLR